MDRGERRRRTEVKGRARRDQHLKLVHPDGVPDCACEHSVWMFAKRPGARLSGMSQAQAWKSQARLGTVRRVDPQRRDRTTSWTPLGEGVDSLGRLGRMRGIATDREETRALAVSIYRCRHPAKSAPIHDQQTQTRLKTWA